MRAARWLILQEGKSTLVIMCIISMVTTDYSERNKNLDRIAKFRRGTKWEVFSTRGANLLRECIVNTVKSGPSFHVVRNTVVLASFRLACTSPCLSDFKSVKSIRVGYQSARCCH